jgi:hypothetical protein
VLMETMMALEAKFGQSAQDTCAAHLAEPDGYSIVGVRLGEMDEVTGCNPGPGPGTGCIPVPSSGPGLDSLPSEIHEHEAPCSMTLRFYCLYRCPLLFPFPCVFATGPIAQ